MKREATQWREYCSRIQLAFRKDRDIARVLQTSRKQTDAGKSVSLQTSRKQTEIFLRRASKRVREQALRR